MRHWKSTSLLCCLWVAGVLLLMGQPRGDGSAVRLLDAWELREAAKGGLVNCTQSLSSAECYDLASTCVGLDKTTCQKMKPCSSCSNDSAQSQDCEGTKPWIVYNCTSGYDPTGCGFLVTGAMCQWVDGACYCSGGTETTTDCPQYLAFFISPCTIVN